MASGVDAITGSKVEKVETLERKQVACAQILHKHLFLLSCAQSEVFESYQNAVRQNQWDFFNLTSLDVHEKLTGELAKTLNKNRPYHYLERAYLYWIEHVAPTALRSNSQQERYSCCKLAKFTAAYLLLAGQYDKAIICLGHAVQLYESDFTSRFLLLQWLCHLGEWGVAKALLRTEDVLTGKNVHYDAIIKAFRFIVELNFGNSNKEALLQELQLLLLTRDQECLDTKANKENIDRKKQQDDIEKKPAKTFLQYQCDVIIYKYLALAARLPNAPIEQIGDPLRNLELSFSKIHTLLKNRYRHFSDNEKAIDLQKAAVDNDSFLKLCSNVAEYCDTAIWLCREHLETGNVRECENIALILWLRKFRMAALSRLIPVFSLLLDVSLLSAASHFKFDEFSRVAVTLISTGKVTVNALESNLRKNGKEESDKMERKIVIESHRSDCSCVVCLLRCTSLQFRADFEFMRLILSRFDTDAYLFYRRRFAEVIRYGKLWMEKMKDAIHLKDWKSIVFKKNHCWFTNREMFLLATIRWLRNDNNSDKRNGIIEEALEICGDIFWHFAPQWLTLRQLKRPSLSVPENFYWLNESMDSMSVSSLAESIKKLTLQTPNCKSRLRIPSRHRSAKATPAKSPGKRLCLSQDPANVSLIELEGAEEDFEHFGHLFYREWRFLIGTYLSHIYAWTYHDCWKASYFISESCTCATRQIGRSIAIDKSPFRFRNLEEFKKAVMLLPPDLSVIQLFLDSERILWLVRFSCSEVPLMVPVKKISRSDQLLKRMQKLLIENDNSGQLAKTAIDSKLFWKIRRDLNNSLESIIKDAQNEWLGVFSPLLLPHSSLTDEGQEVTKQIISVTKLSFESAKVLLSSVTCLSSSEWNALLQRLILVENADVVTHTFFDDVYRRGNNRNHSFVDSNDRKYLLLSIAPELASFPFEMFPILCENQRVCRIPSLYLFHRIFSRSNEIPKCVDSQKTFYVLDPGGDLTDTQNRLSKMLEQYIFWKGIIGQPPKPEELRQYLQNNDFFLYMGHGSGGRYFGKSTIRSSDCRAVSVLMGCSSARTLYEGDGFDGQSVIYDYSVARCPCLVGCLWMVTDGEIDRFLMALVKYCFSNSDGALKDSSKCDRDEGDGYGSFGESYRLLIDAVAYARTACRLRYMTGGAVVSYGLPIVAKNVSSPLSIGNC